MAHEVFYDIEIFDELFTSVKSNGNHSSTIIAYWPASLEHNSSHCEFSAGTIQYFFFHTVAIKLFQELSETTKLCHVFACIHWFDKHPYQDVLPYPLKVFTTLTKQGGSSIFRPIMSCCAEWNTSIKFDFGTDNVLLLCPTNRRIHF